MPREISTRGLDDGHTVIELSDPASGLRASVCPEAGAELAGLALPMGGEPVETLYRALDYRPREGWPGRGPWLWPAVGRTFSPAAVEEILRTGADPGIGSYRLPGPDERTFRMPGHGFAMRSAWALTDSGEDASGAWCECTLASTAQTHECYPFDFTVILRTQVAGGRLGFTWTVRAAETNQAAMPFAAGNHFSFAAPFRAASWEDVTFRTPAAARFLLTPASLLSGETEPIARLLAGPISDTYFHDTVLGGYQDDAVWAELEEPGGAGLRITQRQSPESDVHAPRSAWYFVLYAEPEHGLFCAEPWVGAPNALNEGAPVRLLPGQQWQWLVTVEPLGPSH